MAKYAVVDRDNYILNVIEWDGQTEYHVEGMSLVEIQEGTAAHIGLRVGEDFISEGA